MHATVSKRGRGSLLQIVFYCVATAQICSETNGNINILVEIKPSVRLILLYVYCFEAAIALSPSENLSWQVLIRVISPAFNFFPAAQMLAR